MSGLTFLKTQKLQELTDFYTCVTEMEVWLAQPHICILQHGNLLLGLHEASGEPDLDGLITFFYRDRKMIDLMYERMKHTADDKPRVNEKYRIYHFFVHDPEGRKLEFQTFLHNLNPYLLDTETLRDRRSIRDFTDVVPDDTLLYKVLEACRFSPTSMNTQSFRFVFTRDRKKIEFLSKIRGKSTQPISMATTAVAVCADPGLTKRPEQDACIAGTYFMLAAWSHGLGSCWIAAMDTHEVKNCLEIPQEWHVATVMPVGFPKNFPPSPERIPANDLAIFI